MDVAKAIVVEEIETTVEEGTMKVKDEVCIKHFTPLSTSPTAKPSTTAADIPRAAVELECAVAVTLLSLTTSVTLVTHVGESVRDAAIPTPVMADDEYASAAVELVVLAVLLEVTVLSVMVIAVRVSETELPKYGLPMPIPHTLDPE